MGELHLEIYVERIRREYKVEVEVGAPKVSYREAPTQAGRVQLQAQEADRRLGPIRPHRRLAWSRCPKTPRRRFEFEDNVVGGRIPKNFIPVGRKGLSRSRSTRARSPASRRGREGRSSKTARTTKSTARTWRSRSAPQNCFRETFPKTEAGAAGAGHEDRDRSARRSSKARWRAT